MITPAPFRDIISDFHAQPLPEYADRELNIPLNTGKIITLVGPRRSGKTSELFNLMRQLLQHTAVEIHHLVYINFEDERYDVSTLDLDSILRAYRELYPDIPLSEVYFFFDEIQNIDRWDKFIRRVYDSGVKNQFLSGSNAKLLSREIATSLRGRTLSYQVLPFSFREYCQFQRIDLSLTTTINRANLVNCYQQYLRYGGFPEIINASTELKIKALQEYFNTMMYRDMIERHDIRGTHLLRYFLKRVFASATKSISVNKIYNELKSQGIKVGKDQLYSYLEMTENIYMTLVLRKYSPKIVNQELSEKKVYVVDNGLLNAINYTFSDETGKCMEQLVMQELCRREQTVFFYKDKFECDFVIQQGLKFTQAIQVCHQMDDIDTYQRELNGLTEACHALDIDNGLILTSDRDETIESDGTSIRMQPLYQWLLENNGAKH